jgi:plasmid stability protein
MSKMIQIRNVPDGIHRILKVRAARAGLSLSDYLLKELRFMTERPTPEDLWARIVADGPTDPGESAADAIRAEREMREEDIIREERRRAEEPGHRKNPPERGRPAR